MRNIFFLFSIHIGPVGSQSRHSGDDQDFGPSPHPPGPAQAPGAVSGAQGGGLFSSLRDGANSLMKNVKDASAKVVETVSQWVE